MTVISDLTDTIPGLVPASSLDPTERAPDRPLISDSESWDAIQTVATCFRHTGWQTLRHRIYRALIRTGQPENRILAFTDCGSRAYVCRHRTDTERYAVLGSGCRDRFCIPCQKSRSRVIGQNVTQYLAGGPVRFITLTLRHNHTTLAEQLTRLIAAFTRLRQRKFWKRHVVGGAAFLEVTLSVTEEWHPHLHVLAHGKYIPYAVLRSEWLAVTGDSYITDVRCAKSDAEVVAYVAKYASKPFSGFISRSPPHLDELIHAMHGRRTIVAFGTWRSLKATFEEPTGDWEYLCTLDELVYHARARQAEWMAILMAVAPHRAQAMLERIGDETTRAPPDVPDLQAEQFLLFADTDTPDFYANQ
ncbi:hypothetical protein LCGC14_1743860 [marine sediment metagenome]|uniref:Replication protein n=1 Tax=marine sediment metagenome TaxID=412755 RepID=A0A0F9JL59_9ZZZZ